MSQPRALIFGGAGQDAAYLTQWLLELGYQVSLGVRPSSSGSLWRLDRLGLGDRVRVYRADVTDRGSVREAILQADPGEIYNLAAQGNVGDSWGVPCHTLDTNLTGALNVLLESRGRRLFQASTADQYGLAECPEGGFRASDPMYPVTPYGISKYSAHLFAGIERQLGEFVATGIMFNHESPLRQETFVTQRIARGVARWKQTGAPFELYSLAGARDWGWAPDFVRAMHRALAVDTPADHVLCTGKIASVRDFLEHAVQDNLFTDGMTVRVGLTKRLLCSLTGSGAPKVPTLKGDPQGASDALGWRAEVLYPEIARRMVAAAEQERA